MDTQHVGLPVTEGTIEYQKMIVKTDREMIQCIFYPIDAILVEASIQNTQHPASPYNKYDTRSEECTIPEDKKKRKGK